MTGDQNSQTDSKATLREVTDSVPVRQRWLPQTSIRFYGLLIALCAAAMVAFRAAALSDNLWAEIATLMIATTIACFVLYAALFLVAYLFSNATGLLWRAIAGRSTSDARSQSDRP